MILLIKENILWKLHEKCTVLNDKCVVFNNVHVFPPRYMFHCPVETFAIIFYKIKCV